MAAKIEEIYPPHINSFAESTNDSVTTSQIIGQEYKVCNLLNWNFEQFITNYTWATWFMKRWDEYVDESLSYLKQQFQLKFFESTRESNEKYLTFMQFVDILSLSFQSKQYTQRMVVACIMYLILGGKNIMCAFQIDYRDMLQAFTQQFPIVDPSSFNEPTADNKPQRIPEGILFYNQIIEPFFVKEFGLYLHEMIEPLKFVLKFFILDIEEGKEAPYGLIQQCKCTLKQHREIVLEKVVALQDNVKYYGSMYMVDCIEKFLDSTKEFTDEDVYLNVNEFFSYQTYNPQTLDTLKFIQTLDQQEMYKSHTDSSSDYMDRSILKYPQFQEQQNFVRQPVTEIEEDLLNNEVIDNDLLALDTMDFIPNFNQKSSDGISMSYLEQDNAILKEQYLY